MGIVIARYYGALYFTKITEAVAHLDLAIFEYCSYVAGAFLACNPLLQYLDTPAEILPQS